MINNRVWGEYVLYNKGIRLFFNVICIKEARRFYGNKNECI